MLNIRLPWWVIGRVDSQVEPRCGLQIIDQLLHFVQDAGAVLTGDDHAVEDHPRLLGYGDDVLVVPAGEREDAAAAAHAGVLQQRDLVEAGHQPGRLGRGVDPFPGPGGVGRLARDVDPDQRLAYRTQ